jgi:hypothetical protein
MMPVPMNKRVIPTAEHFLINGYLSIPFPLCIIIKHYSPINVYPQNSMLLSEPNDKKGENDRDF